MSLSSKIKKFLLFGALLACFGKDGKSQIAIYVISSSSLPARCSVSQGAIHFKTSGGAGVEGLYFCGPANDEWTYTGITGSGIVTSISGTTNEITASGSTGAVTLSIPSTFVTPGTVSSTDSIMRGSSSGQVDWASNADGSCLTSTNLTYTFHICYLNNGEFEITDEDGNPGHIYFQKSSYLNPYNGTGANAIPVCGTGGTVHAIGTVTDPVTTTVNAVYVPGGTNNSNYLVSCENVAGTYQWVLLDGSGLPGGSNYNGYGMWQLTIPAGLTNWLNQGSSVSVTGTHFVAIAAPASSAYSLRILNEPCPSGFTGGTLDLYALVVSSGPVQSGITTGGIEFDDGTKVFTLGESFNATSSQIASVTNTATSGGTQSGINSDNLEQPLTTPIWYHAHDSSGNLTFDYSFDGVGTPGVNGGWRRLTTSSNGNLSAVTNCGFYANSQSSGFFASTTILSYGFASSLTAQ
jgi:hypothetical protein